MHHTDTKRLSNLHNFMLLLCPIILNIYNISADGCLLKTFSLIPELIGYLTKPYFQCSKHCGSNCCGPINLFGDTDLQLVH